MTSNIQHIKMQQHSIICKYQTTPTYICISRVYRSIKKNQLKHRHKHKLVKERKAITFATRNY